MEDQDKRQTDGPLQGLKVIDMTRMLPGPFGTMMLADLGADVTVVEHPSGPALGPRRKNFYIDRNKRSLALNLKDQRALEILYKLVKDADVFVEGFRPGVTERLGIDYKSLTKVNQCIIYCAMSGYGQDGPYKLRAGHDINYVATAGLLHLNGRKDSGPVIFATQLADIAGGGMIAAYSILAALYYRARTGKGQYIDVSMTDGALALNPLAFLEYSNSGKPPEPQGYRNLGATPCYNVYRTKDGQYVSLGALEPKFWSNLCRLIGREDLLEKQNNTDDTTIEDVRQVFADKTRAEWDQLLNHEEVCYAPILDLAETFKNPQVVHRQMVDEATWADGSRGKQAGVVPKFSLTPGSLRRPPSRPGQHSYEILRELGLDSDTIAELEADGVVKG